MPRLSRWMTACLTILALSGVAWPQEQRVLLIAPPGELADRVMVAIARQLPRVTLLSPQDPEVQRVVTVPFSARPVLALGRYGPEGRLEALSWQIDASQPQPAVTALKAHLEDLATRPRVELTSPTAADREVPLRLGQTLWLRASGTPAAEVSARLGSGPPLPLREERPGFYVASYEVRENDSGLVPVQVTLTNARGTSSSAVREVRLEGLTPPQVESVEQVGTRRWLISGTALPNAEVRGTLQLDGRRRDLRARTDPQGRFLLEWDSRRWLSAAVGEFRLQTVTETGSASPLTTQNVRFQGQEAFRPVRMDPVWGGGFGWGWGPFPAVWGPGPCGPWGGWGPWGW